jgi:hypothetical protein
MSDILYCFVLYIAIGVIIALTFAWKNITKDVTSMLIVTYFWPAFIIWLVFEKVFIKWPTKMYRKFNRYLRKRKG